MRAAPLRSSKFCVDIQGDLNTDWDLIETWLIQNCGEYNGRWNLDDPVMDDSKPYISLNRVHGRMTVYFENEHDALLFKLRWG
jgi:hypothetical protein